ncbi:hypothetical protein [uncultured Faecalibaculum sp.]|uniref:hypothetical protein n=1 Tax=uncultured Faecalibaculum sp. TaxID=1729681 RepID=UPI00260A898D|nr:hypothetical protein [uncultured Faecalibaculum sp.]
MEMGHFGFSWVGFIFLVMLMVPNLFWAKKKPAGYSSADENRVLRILERIGEVLVTFCLLTFTDLNLHGWSVDIWWLITAFILMILYEIWWIRYFRSPGRLEDFYGSLLGIPVPGATLPVIAAFFLGLYSRLFWLQGAALILGIGHIGIHLQHRRQLTQKEEGHAQQR